MYLCVYMKDDRRRRSPEKRLAERKGAVVGGGVFGNRPGQLGRLMNTVS